METVYRSGFVAIIGRPNVGKSTLMNHLIGQKIAITSSKPQTTRNRIRTVYTEERGQIVFLDTPGIHKAANRLGEYMDEAAWKTIEEADLVLWIVEPVTFSGAGERMIAEKLSSLKKKVILVMNKCDTKSKDEVKEAMDAYSKLYSFGDIIPVSALRGKNLDSVLDAIFRYLPEGEPFYDEEMVTDQTMRQIASEMIREQALRCLNDEVPHGIAVEIDSMKQRDSGLWDIHATIITERNSHKGIIIGKGGAMLRKIGSQARTEIETMVGDRVNLQLFVKVREKWRDSESMMKALGYNKKDLG